MMIISTGFFWHFTSMWRVLNFEFISDIILSFSSFLLKNEEQEYEREGTEVYPLCFIRHFIDRQQKHFCAFSFLSNCFSVQSTRSSNNSSFKCIGALYFYSFYVSEGVIIIFFHIFTVFLFDYSLGKYVHWAFTATAFACFFFVVFFRCFLIPFCCLMVYPGKNLSVRVFTQKWLRNFCFTLLKLHWIFFYRIFLCNIFKVELHL